MNKSEKRALSLILFLFFLGALIRYLPFGLEEIGETPVTFRETADALAWKSSGKFEKKFSQKNADSPGKFSPENGESDFKTFETSAENSDFLNEDEFFKEKGAVLKSKQGKKSKKKASGKRKVKLPLAINSASAEDLCAIPGVGPLLASQIIEFRATRGPLKNEADLQKIPGIGKKKSKKILDSIIFD